RLVPSLTVITQACCSDGSCIVECPVDCIRPRPEDVDPDSCINCGACVSDCPMDAIQPDDELEGRQRGFLDLNAAYLEQHPLLSDLSSIVPTAAAFAARPSGPPRIEFTTAAALAEIAAREREVHV
ncbi:hypothetical protein NBRGN_101_00010, partial [Nocardia brasiliensis NBRC 14402]